MRMSELSDRSGISVATVKYYLREELLDPGEALNARESSYGEKHLERLRLIRGLLQVVGASITQVREVLSIIDEKNQTPLEAMGRATSALPAISAAGIPAPENQAKPQLATKLLTQLGFRFDPDSPTVSQLDTALGLASDVGIPLDDAQIRVYRDAARELARADFARVPWAEVEESKTFAVLGTVLYEPVILALRRLAHYEIGLELEAQQAGAAAPTQTTPHSTSTEGSR